jgi:hypothetical protein
MLWGMQVRDGVWPRSLALGLNACVHTCVRERERQREEGERLIACVHTCLQVEPTPQGVRKEKEKENIPPRMAQAARQCLPQSSSSEAPDPDDTDTHSDTVMPRRCVFRLVGGGAIKSALGVY